MNNISIRYLSGPDVTALKLTNDEILDAVDSGLIAAGQGETVVEPRLHLTPDPAFNGHFNILRGYVAPLKYAEVKIVGDYVDNYKQGLPSEMALLNLFDPRTGTPLSVLDASGITDMRTGAVTALGAKRLAPENSRVLGHIGARGTAYWNVRLLDHLFDFDEIRVHLRRPKSREAFAEKLRDDLGKILLSLTIGKIAWKGLIFKLKHRDCQNPHHCSRVPGYVRIVWWCRMARCQRYLSTLPICLISL
jgi:ornithine cyclodeaminase